MKYILIITFTLNSLLLASSQVVLGSYSSALRAINVKEQIDNIIVNDFRFKNFLKKKKIETKIEESGKYFIIAIGPINDVVTKRAILNRVKKTKFKDAYLVEKIKEIEVLEQEPKIEDIIVNTPKTIVPIKTKKIEPQKNYKNDNMLDAYFIEIIATITILLLSIIYLIIKRRQHINNEYANLNLKKRELVQIDDPYKYTQETTNEDENIYEIPENDEIVFDNLDKIENTAKEVIASSITSNILKKQVPEHAKITKNDFKDFKDSRIMIAEDNIINQKIISDLLSDSEIAIVVVDDGQEVLNFLEKDSDFSIILMDVHMPNIDGYEATEHIRSNSKYSHIIIVALSGDTTSDDIKKMKDVGMQEYLEKPLKMDALYDILYSYSRKRKSYEELEKALFIEDGLEVCGGNEKFYKEILSDFIKDNADSTDEIKKLLNSKEFYKAQEFLLDMMGVAGNIGANKIQELAAGLRISIDTYEDNRYLDLFKIYSKNYKQLEKEVKDYL